MLAPPFKLLGGLAPPGPPSSYAYGYVTLEQRLRECYQATPLEAISDNDWLMYMQTCVDSDNNVRLVK